VKSSQSDSEIIRVQIDWDGGWHHGDKEMQKLFKVKIPPSAPPAP